MTNPSSVETIDLAMRKGTACDMKLASFLMCAGGRFYFSVGSQLGIERSLVGFQIRDAGNDLGELYPDIIRPLRNNADVQGVQKKTATFQDAGI